MKHQGMPDKHAELEYVKEMMILPEYGLHFYKVFQVSLRLYFFTVAQIAKVTQLVLFRLARQLGQSGHQ